MKCELCNQEVKVVIPIYREKTGIMAWLKSFAKSEDFACIECFKRL